MANISAHRLELEFLGEEKDFERGRRSSTIATSLMSGVFLSICATVVAILSLDYGTTLKFNHPIAIRNVKEIYDGSILAPQRFR